MPEDLAPVAHLRFWLLDPVDPALASDLVARVSRLVLVPCRLAGTRSGLELRWIAGRQQVDAMALLQALEAEGGGEDDGVWIGLTDHDIAIPVFTHVFGVARHHGRAAVVSLARLRPEFYGLPRDTELTAHRAVRETLHELGHVLGLEHCRDFECVMHFAPDVESIDLRGASYCPGCRDRIPREFAGH